MDGSPCPRAPLRSPHPPSKNTCHVRTARRLMMGLLLYIGCRLPSSFKFLVASNPRRFAPVYSNSLKSTVSFNKAFLERSSIPGFTRMRGGFGECSLPLFAVVPVSFHSRFCLLSLFSWCMGRTMHHALSRRLFPPVSLSIIRPSNVFTLIKRRICALHARRLVDAFAQTLQVGYDVPRGRTRTQSRITRGEV